MQSLVQTLASVQGALFQADALLAAELSKRSVTPLDPEALSAAVQATGAMHMLRGHLSTKLSAEFTVAAKLLDLIGGDVLGDTSTSAAPAVTSNPSADLQPRATAAPELSLTEQNAVMLSALRAVLPADGSRAGIDYQALTSALEGKIAYANLANVVGRLVRAKVIDRHPRAEGEVSYGSRYVYSFPAAAQPAAEESPAAKAAKAAEAGVEPAVEPEVAASLNPAEGPLGSYANDDDAGGDDPGLPF